MRDEADELLLLARGVVQSALAGADVAEATVGKTWDLSAKVRLGEPELVEEAGQRGLSLRVIKSGRVAMSSTSDLSEAGLARVVADALELADLSEPDPYVGPLDPKLLCAPPHPELQLFDPALDHLDADAAIERARRAEKAAFDYDGRITLSEGATFSRTSGMSALVLSSHFEGVQRGSYAALSVAPVVEDEGGKRRRGSYWTARRHLDELESEAAVGQEAARRTLAKLGARKVETCEVPVIFDKDAARSILGTFAGCIAGGALWRKSSYLLGRLGTPVASSLVHIIDDPLIPRAPGSRAYDGEGLRSRRNQIVSGGKLETYLLDAYAARKLDMQPTASASRSGGSIGASTSNFIMQAGSLSPEELIASTKRGLLVTEMMGFGFNGVTGDFSRGAAGFWIENGAVAFPVGEVTISSNLDAMLLGIDAIANDLELKTSTAAPSFRVTSMTVAGS